MDYSAQYCRMCESCKELKSLRKSIPKEDQHIVIEKSPDKFVATDSVDGIFIPTDKQIHRLIDFQYDPEDPYFKFIKNPYHKYEIKTPFNIFRSFEQYALAYAMKSLYSKVWFNNKWIEEENIDITK